MGAKTNTLLYMDTKIQVFNHEQFGEIRTMMMPDGQIGFVGKDVAEVLGYSIPQKAILQHVSEDDRMTLTFKAFSKMEKASLWRDNDYSNKTIINESGLYSLILSSKLPQAREFKHWVTSEVLPQIRKTGGYIPVKEEDDEKTILSKALMICRRTIEEKEALLEEQKPKVVFAEAVTSCEDSILIRDLAKLLTQNGVAIGQARLFYWMRLHGYLFQRETRPIQKWVEQGLFDTTVTLVNTHHGTKERITTKVTGKGQRYFIEGFVSGRFKAENGSF